MTSQWSLDLRAALPSWMEARFYVASAYVVTWAVVDRLEPPPDFSPVNDGLLAWDGTWYQRIAEHGYADADDPAVRFFPLWPLLGRWVGWIGDRPDVALVILANVFALAAAMLLHRVVIEETGDAATARRAVRLLALFPPSFVLVLAYSEALYLTLAIAFVLALQQRRWWPAAALAYLAGLTRPVAGLLAFSSAIVAWRSGSLRRPGALASIVAAPLGTLTFLGWSGLALDDWGAPLDRQRELRGGVAEPATRLVRALGDAINGDEGEALHLAAALLVIGLTVIVARRLSPMLWAYTIPSTVALLAADNLNSMERYALSAFPLVIAAAIVSRRPVLDRWLPTTAAVGLVLATVLALNGVYVP